jgi:PAS domain S-box-containing protein
LSEGPRNDSKRHAAKTAMNDEADASAPSGDIIRGITGNTRGEAALRLLREQATLLDAAADAIYVTALDCTITYWNQGAERVYGWTRDEALNRKTTELISLDGTAAELSEIVLKKEHWSGERRQIKRDGKAVDVFSRLMLVRDKQGRPKSIFAINTDITEKKLLEERSLRAQQLENIGMLAAGVAHDLNNVLTPIMAIASLLRPRLSSEGDLKILDTLEQSAQRGAGLVREIMSFVRSSTGELRPTQVKQIASDIINLVEETFPKSIRLEAEIGPDLWLVLGNATQIHQVLLNLCINARDAMPKGGTLRIVAANRRLDAAEAAAIPTARPGAWLMLEVADTGTGIEPEVQKSIWMPFFTTKGVGRGTGLGLSTIRGIVANHGGFVDLQTEVGLGSAFRVFLPAVEGADSQPSSASPSGIPHGRGKLVLVVDDEASIRAVITAVLRRHNYGVLSCGDGMEAISVFKAHRDEIALVVIDVDMPNLNGAALARMLLRIRPDIRLIVMSGSPRSDTASSDVAMARGLAHAFLAKPFRPEDLLAAVQSLLNQAP